MQDEEKKIVDGVEVDSASEEVVADETTEVASEETTAEQA